MNQKFLPLGGVNLSTSLSLIPPTDYTAAFNCHISNDSEGKAGAITNIMGNVATSIPYFEVQANNPYSQYYKQTDIINGGFVYPTISELNGVNINGRDFEAFFFENHKGRVLGVYEEPEKRRLYYYIGWDGFTYRTTTSTIESAERKNSGILALVCFEQYETISDYYILQQNGSIIITDDGDFLINEASEDGDLLGQTYLVGIWGFGDETFTWGDTFSLTGIGKIGNEMYWAMGDKFDPMTIDVERGILTYQSSYVSEYETDNEVYRKVDRALYADTYYEETVANTSDQDRLDYLNPQEFTFIKRGGLNPLRVVSTYDATRPRILGSRVLQFAYRYVYKNGYRSVLSPYTSKLRSAKLDDAAYYNVVDLNFPENEIIPSDVDRVEFCVRKGVYDSTDTSWTVIESKDREDMLIQANGTSSVYTTEYTGDRTGEVVDPLSGAMLFEAVPYRAEALEVASNRVFMGNVIPAGSFDVSADDFTLEFETEAFIPTSVTGNYVLWEVLANGSLGFFESYFIIFLVVNDGTNTGANGIYPVSNAYDTANFVAGTLPSSSSVTVDDAIVSWAGTSKTEPDQRAAYDAYLTAQNPNLNYNVVIPSGSPTNPQGAITMPNLELGSGAVQYKSGGAYQFGIIPFDEKGRTCGVITDPEWIIQADERSYADVETFAAVQCTYVDAPSWVKRFAFARTKCLNISAFYQYKGSGTQSVRYAKSKRVDEVTSYELTTAADADFLAVSLKGLQEQGRGFELNPESVYKVVVKDATQEVDVSPLALHVDSGDELYLICTLATFTTVTTIADQPIIEIRELQATTERPLFYETNTFGNTGGAGQQFYVGGDTYLVESNGIVVESQNTSLDKNYFLDLNIGRPYISAPDQKQKRIGDRIYFSGLSTPDSERTFINGVSALDYQETSDNGGDIQRLIMTSTTDIYGQVMLAIAETNTTSIYLGETLVRDKDGNMQTTASDKVIGGMSEVRGMYGTAHRMSVSAYQGVVCWYDVNKGAVVMYSSSGIEVISDMGMSNYFRTMADFVRPLNLAATINRRYNQYHITIGADSDRPVRDLNGYSRDEGTIENPFEYADGFVLVFDMDTKRWMTALTMDPEAMGSIGVLPAQFNEGRLWLQKSGSRNKFFGTTNRSSIAVVLNAPPEAVKVPEAISIEADNVPTHVYIQNLRPYQQQTDIDQTEFVEKEGIYYAPILRDRLTGNPVDDQDYLDNLFNGEKIRGQYIQIALIMDYPDDDFEVNAINVKFNMSSGHSTGRSRG